MRPEYNCHMRGKVSHECWLACHMRGKVSHRLRDSASCEAALLEVGVSWRAQPRFV